jgi:uncharacterized Fe-S radical SAM superfamily protein PflX
MTKQEAKELSLEVWEYMAAHPETRGKHRLPEPVFSKVKNLLSYCPLCELFRGVNTPKRNCGICPLKDCSMGSSPFLRSFFTETNEERQAAALDIVDKIKAWEVEE